jgi:hypothetical protein
MKRSLVNTFLVVWEPAGDSIHFGTFEFVTSHLGNIDICERTPTSLGKKGIRVHCGSLYRPRQEEPCARWLFSRVLIFLPHSKKKCYRMFFNSNRYDPVHPSRARHLLQNENLQQRSFPHFSNQFGDLPRHDPQSDADDKESLGSEWDVVSAVGVGRRSRGQTARSQAARHQLCLARRTRQQEEDRQEKDGGLFPTPAAEPLATGSPMTPPCLQCIAVRAASCLYNLSRLPEIRDRLPHAYNLSRYTQRQ